MTAQGEQIYLPKKILQPHLHSKKKRGLGFFLLEAAGKHEKFSISEYSQGKKRTRVKKKIKSSPTKSYLVQATKIAHKGVTSLGLMPIPSPL